MSDYNPSQVPTISTPITPSDEATYDLVGLYIGTAGHVVGRLAGDNADRTWKNVPAGSYLLGKFKYIKTGTTAGDILGMR